MKNLIAWVEIPSTDFERAVSFYESFLNLKLKVHDFGSEKMAHFPNDEGAIIMAEGYKPSSDGTLVSFNVENDIEAALERIEEVGGKVHTPKTKIQAEGRAYFAVVFDSEGNRIGLYGS